MKYKQLTKEELKKLDKLTEKVSDLGDKLIGIGDELIDIAGLLQKLYVDYKK